MLFVLKSKTAQVIKRGFASINMHIDVEKLLKGLYEAEALPKDFTPERIAPDFGFNILNKSGILYKPMIDEQYLNNGGVKPTWPDRKSFAVCLTHDVDHVSLHSLRQWIRQRIEELKRTKSHVALNFSIPYNVAVILIDKKLTPEQFTEERIVDPEIQELAKKVRLSMDIGLTAKTAGITLNLCLTSKSRAFNFLRSSLFSSPLNCTIISSSSFGSASSSFSWSTLSITTRFGSLTLTLLSEAIIISPAKTAIPIRCIMFIPRTPSIFLYK